MGESITKQLQCVLIFTICTRIVMSGVGVCILESSDTVRGTLRFETVRANGMTRVTGEVSGLRPGKHGFHIHQFGDYTAGCASAGSHFNPFKKQHGGPADEDRHAGDLGNIEADAEGKAKIDIVDAQIPLEGPNNILGRSVVVHVDADDLGRGGHDDSLTTGHAGGRLACGVIGIARP